MGRQSQLQNERMVVLLGLDKQVRVEAGESCMVTLRIVDRAVIDQVP